MVYSLRSVALSADFPTPDPKASLIGQWELANGSGLEIEFAPTWEFSITWKSIQFGSASFSRHENDDRYITLTHVKWRGEGDLSYPFPTTTYIVGFEVSLTEEILTIPASAGSIGIIPVPLVRFPPPKDGKTLTFKRKR
jgi:hypothetical protein